MKALMIGLMILGMAGIAQAHNKYQWTCIALTSLGAYTVTRVSVDKGLSIAFPKMSKENKAGWIGVAGFATAYAMWRIGARMNTEAAQHDQGNMMHAFKDNSVPILVGIGMTWDAWRLGREKKRDFKGGRR